MDPYLEVHWGDVHHSLITYARDQLQSRLPTQLRARAEERVFVEDEDGLRRVVYPDVRVLERPTPGPTTPPVSNGGVAVAEPLVVRVPVEEVTQGYIEIREVGSGHRVVTVIEFISPSNKQAGAGRDLYLQKQQELRAGGVNSVEIDLLRAGESVLALRPAQVPPDYRTPYRVCVRRAARSLAYEVYRLPLRERLPAIRIPLRESDADVPLDLQALIDQCYANGGYDDLDYTVAPDPPLATDDAQWADDLLRSKGLRSESRRT
jgi:hypothetical protein